MKKKLVPLQDKNILTNSDNSAICSYKGWLKYCDSYRLWEKYFTPLKDKYYICEKGYKRRVNICLK